MPKTPIPSPDELGQICLAYLAEHPGELQEFMVQTGLTPDTLRHEVAAGRLAPGLIDHVAQNESLLLAVCAFAGLAPENFMRVWARLNPAG